MLCFRVRDAQTVEAFISYKVMDGVGYVMTGGAHRPYIEVSDDLVRQSEGLLTRVSVDSGLPRKLLLTPEAPTDTESALVILPSTKALWYASQIKNLTIANDDCARAVIMRRGEVVIARPVARSISESAGAPSIRFEFDGAQLLMRAS